MLRINKKLSPSLQKSNTSLCFTSILRKGNRTNTKNWQSFFYLCFLLCEEEGAQPRVAADICCLFLLKQTQPGANSWLNPAWVPRTRWYPRPGEAAAALGPLVQHWVFWAQLPMKWGGSCFRSPCQSVLQIAFSSLKTLP